jgi:hypothetical protein
MRYYLSVAALIFSTAVAAQVHSGKASGLDARATNTQRPDTTLKVIYANQTQSGPRPAYFINGSLVKSLTFPDISTNSIENINVVQGDTVVGNVLYSGRLFIETKKGMTPKLISLTGLKNKYTDLKGKTVLFTLDGNLVDDDYDNYLVDENNLLTIIVDKSKVKLGTTPPDLIRLLTRSEANIKARNQIMIRGADLTMHR